MGERLKAREARFAAGTAKASETDLFDAEALRKRKERFATPGKGGVPAEGTAKMDQMDDKAEELDRKRKRAERFGGSIHALADAGPEGEKKKQRLERFGIAGAASEAAKKELRATRFQAAAKA